MRSGMLVGEVKARNEDLDLEENAAEMREKAKEETMDGNELRAETGEQETCGAKAYRRGASCLSKTQISSTRCSQRAG